MVKKNKVRLLKNKISQNQHKLATAQLHLSETEQTIAQQQGERDELVKLVAESEARIKALEQSLLLAQNKLSAEQKSSQTIIQASFIEIFGKK